MNIIKKIGIIIVTIMTLSVFSVHEKSYANENIPSNLDVGFIIDTVNSDRVNFKHLGMEILNDSTFDNSTFTIFEVNKANSFRLINNPDKEVAKSTMDSLKFGLNCDVYSNRCSGASMYYALNSMEYQWRNSNKQKVLFVFTTFTSGDYWSIVDNLKKQGVIVYTISNDNRYSSVLSRLAGKGDGIYQIISKNANAQEELEGVWGNMKTHLERSFPNGQRLPYGAYLNFSVSTNSPDASIQNLYGQEAVFFEKREFFIEQPFKISGEDLEGGSIGVSVTLEPLPNTNLRLPSIYQFNKTENTLKKVKQTKTENKIVFNIAEAQNNEATFVLLDEYIIKGTETIFALDGTSAMSTLDPENKRKTDLISFIENDKKYNGSISIMNYNDVPSIFTSRTNNINSISNAINKVTNSNNTEFNPYECFYGSYCFYEERDFSIGRNFNSAFNSLTYNKDPFLTGQKKAMVFIAGYDQKLGIASFGDTEYYYPSYETMINNALTKNVSIYTIFLKEGSDICTADFLKSTNSGHALKKLSVETNGAFCQVNENKSVRDCLNVIQEHIIKNGTSSTTISGEDAVLKISELDNSKTEEKSLVSDPIDSSTGAFLLDKNLIKYSGDKPFVYSIHYNSLLNSKDTNGYGWHDNFHIRLLKTEEGLYQVQWSNNKKTTLAATQCGTFQPLYNSTDVKDFIINSDGTSKLVMKNSTIYHFNSNGFVTKQENPEKEVIGYTYNEANALIKVTQFLSGMEEGNVFYFTYRNGLVSSIRDTTDREIRFEYNDLNRLVKITDAKGVNTYFEYDSNHRIIASQNHNLETYLTNKYDVKGRTVEQTDAKGNKTTLHYDEESLEGHVVTSITNRNGDTKVLVHDNNYRLIEEINENGNKTTYQYDSFGRRISFVDAKKNKTLMTYDGQGNMVSIKDPRGKTTTMKYDTRSNLIETKNPAGDIVKSEYNSDNQLTAVTDVNGNKSYFNYENGLLVSQTNTLGETTYFSYENGRMKSTTNYEGHEISFNYDELGRVIETTDAKGNKTSYSYDNNDNLIKQIDAKGNVTSYVYDNNNLLIEEIDAKGYKTTYVYDKNHNLEIKERGKAVIKYTYDNEDRIIETLDSEGNKSSYEYNAIGKLVKSVSPEGHIVTYNYDDVGNLLSQTVGNATTRFEYDAAGLIIKETNPNGYYKTIKYNAIDLPIEELESNGAKTTYSYDKKGNLLHIIDPNGKITYYSYDREGKLVSLTDARGHKTSFYYNLSGNLYATQDPLFNTTYFEYDKNGNLVIITDALWNSSTKEYDELNRIVRISDPMGNSSRVEYDELGNVIAAFDSYNNKVRGIKYNEFNQPTELVDALGFKTFKTYDTLGNVIGEINSLGKETIHGYTPNGLMSSTTDSLGKTANVSYNQLNQPNEIIDLNQNKTQFLYDKLGNIIKETTANGNIFEFNYDTKGQLYRKVDGKGQVSTYQYDKIGNILSVTDKKGTIRYTYDNNYNVTKIVETRGTQTFTIDREYDALNRLVFYKDTMGNITKYKYNEVGSLIEIIYPNGKSVYFTYDAANRLIEVKDWKDRVTTYFYDKNSRLIETVLPNKTKELRKYDLNGQLTELKNIKENGELISNDNFEYDSNGNVIRENDHTYVYDSLNRLILHDNNTVHYDAMGNIISSKKYPQKDSIVLEPEDIQIDEGQISRSIILKEPETTNLSINNIAIDPNITLTPNTNNLGGIPTSSSEFSTQELLSNSTTNNTGNTLSSYDILSTQTPEETTDYVYGRDNILLKYNDTVLSYDQNGSITGIGGDSASYSARNELETFKGISYDYDAEGRRIKLTNSNGDIQQFAYNPNAKLDQMLLEFDGSNSIVNSYVHGLGLIYKEDNNGEALYYHYDRRGSVIAITNEAGDTVQKYDYNVWGEITSEEGDIEQIFKYNGKFGIVTDDNGLYHMRSRYYNPEIKRFMSRDIVVGHISDPQTFNRYAFVNGNPVSYIDPFGTSKILDNIQLGLDILGLVPVLGEFADGINVAVYLARGDYGNALLSAGAMIPFAGALATAGKFASKGMKAVKSMEKADDIGVAGKTASKANDSPRNTHPCRLLCFAAGTKVMTKDGEKPIEEIKVGDKILSKNEDTGEIKYKSVVRLFKRVVNETYTLKIGKEEIITTDEHPFWVKGKGWVEAKYLKIGDILTTYNGKEIPVNDIVINKEHRIVYNFEVADFHSYFVSNLGVWVHNCGGDSKNIDTTSQGYLSKVKSKTQLSKEYPESAHKKPSTILREELKLAEIPNPPYPNAAHHLVAINESRFPSAIEARELLDFFEIDPNSAANGLLLPTSKTKYVGDQAIHSGGHGEEYYKKVASLLHNVKDTYGKDTGKAVEALNFVRQMLLSGTWNLK